MAFFRYTAIDSAGKSLDGTVQAKDLHDAQGILSKRGFRSIQVAVQTSGYVRTRKISDNQRFMLFTQAASLIRAGINPFEAFRVLAGRVSSSQVADACREISAASGEGKRISDVMEKYLDIFPHNAVGMVRAGEYGGFLPEALEYLAMHFSDSTAFKRWFWILKFFTWQGVIGLVLAIPVIPAMWAAFHQEGTFFSIYSKVLLFPTLPIAGAIFVLLFLFARWMGSYGNTVKRHSFILRIPWGIGSRARNESLRAFLWTLRNLSKGGVPPGQAWNLAAGSVPNANYALRLNDAGNMLGTEKPLADAVTTAGLFPMDYDALLRTAQQTGDIVGTLDRMLVLTDEEFETSKVKARVGLSSIGCLIVLVLSGAMMVYLVKGCYGRMENEVEKFMDE